MIRRAELHETDRLTTLAHRSKAHWGYPQEWLDLWADDLRVTEEMIRRFDVLVAEDEGRVAGYGVLATDGAGFEIDALFVDPDALGRGHGRRLLARLLDLAREHDARIVEVLSDPHAEDFYVKHGFLRVGETPSRPEGRMLPRLELALDFSVLTRQLAEMQRIADDPALLAGASATSEWSVIEHLEHLVRVGDRVINGLERIERAQNGERGEPEDVWHQVDATGAIPRGARAPRFVIPRDWTPDEMPERVEALAKRLGDFEPRLSAVHKLGFSFPHHVFGFLSPRRWMRFLEIHQEHHLRIIREIAESKVG